MRYPCTELHLSIEINLSLRRLQPLSGIRGCPSCLATPVSQESSASILAYTSVIPVMEHTNHDTSMSSRQVCFPYGKVKRLSYPNKILREQIWQGASRC